MCLSRIHGNTICICYPLAVTEEKKGAPSGIGSVRVYTCRSILPYQLAFHMELTGLEQYRYLQGIAYNEMEGEDE